MLDWTTSSLGWMRIVYYRIAFFKSYIDNLWHQIDNPVIAIKVPLLCEVWEHYFAPLRHKWAWWTFILQAFGTEFLIVFPTSIGLDRYQFPIYSAIWLRFNSPFPLIRPLIIEKLSYESSVGCPAYRWCFPPPIILKAFIILFYVISLSNYKWAPITSPKTAPHNAPLI